MNSDLIKAKLKLIHEQLVDSLFWQETKDLIKNKTYFAGGCVRDLLRDKEPKDYDLYFYDYESNEQFIKLVVKEFQFKGTKIGNFNSKTRNVQIITIVSDMPDKMINSFDFTINQGYYLPQLDVIKMGDTGNLLVPCEKVHTPVQALLRVHKFLKQGYSISAESIIELAIQISQNGAITNKEELKSALLGMSYSEVFDGNFQVLETVSNKFKFDDIPF